MTDIFKRSLKAKLIILLAGISVVSVFCVGIFVDSSAERALKNAIMNNLTAIIQSREDAVTSVLRLRLEQIEILAANVQVQGLMETWNKKEQGEKIDEIGLEKETDDFIKVELPEYQGITPFYNFIFIGQTGKVCFSTDESIIGSDFSRDDRFLKGLKEKFITDIMRDKKTNKPAYGIVVPIMPHEAIHTSVIGVLIVSVDPVVINSVMTNREGMGESGETYIVNKDGLMITESRFIPDAVLKQRVDTELVKLFQAQKKIMTGVYPDYRGIPVVGASMGDDIFKEFPDLGWILLAEVDVSEAFAPIARLRNNIILITLLVLVGIFILGLRASQSIINPIKVLSVAAGKIAQGDLTTCVLVKTEDEIGLLAESFCTMQKAIGEILVKIKEASSCLSSSSSEILASSQEQAAASQEQSAAVSETTAAARELAKSGEQVAESIKRVLDAANQSMLGMSKIKEAIAKTQGWLSSLSEKSKQIGNITELIDDVSDQSNLLAVNAAIEAARAGEQGKGFGVVADEIRKLADSTAKSAKDIASLIELIQHEMSNAVISMEASTNNVNEESKLSQETAERAKEISMSTTQQISGSKQIAEAMFNIDSAMKQVATGAQQAQVAAKQLNGLAGELDKMIGRFKTS